VASVVGLVEEAAATMAVRFVEVLVTVTTATAMEAEVVLVLVPVEAVELV
jgi:hypothetical protein